MIVSLIFCLQGCHPNMEAKTSLLDNMIGVGDMVLLEPLSEDTFIENLKKRFDHNEIYLSLPVNAHRPEASLLQEKPQKVLMVGPLKAALTPENCYRVAVIIAPWEGGMQKLKEMILTALQTSAVPPAASDLPTYIGSVVISMNPYKSLPIYTPEKVEEYRNRNFYELSPHM
ncbi:hypothetical protein DNTS_011115 [Danionella cerebrum]|uniref:Myosin motor domain-containing protein n=1 Tax=Danionella cerebrum TaxID=2873325 RepID=A0A553MMF4_9TELE|nr:hypothetical protein DNTS_011115 [Danionella translucida]